MCIAYMYDGAFVVPPRPRFGRNFLPLSIGQFRRDWAIVGGDVAVRRLSHICNIIIIIRHQAGSSPLLSWTLVAVCIINLRFSDFVNSVSIGGIYLTVLLYSS